MSLSDPIADLLTRIRNAKDAKHRYVDVGFSKTKANVAKILHQQGFIDNILVNEEEKKIRIFIRYAEGREPVIQGLKKVSSPGLRRYVKCKDIPKILGGLGIAILSTPAGIVDGETAKRLKVGGELMCYVW
jgi:small subunit ribosomal protein S8